MTSEIQLNTCLWGCGADRNKHAVQAQVPSVFNFGNINVTPTDELRLNASTRGQPTGVTAGKDLHM